jgi:hypothetical protein
MEKAYDLKDLGLKLKSKGLDLAEDASKIVADSVFEWFEESAKLSSTPYDDMALIVLPQIKSFVAGQIDKIDGKVG